MLKRTLSPLFLSCILFAYIIQIAPPADAANLNISVKLTDVDNRKPINAKVILETNEHSGELFSKRAGMYEFKGSMGPDHLESYEFIIEAQEPYANRNIKIRGDSLKGKVERSFDFSIAKDKGTEFTYQYLGKGYKYFDSNQFDSALAYYETAYATKGASLDDEAGHRIDMFDIQLVFNYARALHNTCIILRYDTCDSSAAFFNKMLSLYDHGRYKRIFSNLGIRREELTKVINDLAAVAPIKKYSRISVLFKAGMYEEAAFLAAEGLQEYEENPQVFSNIGLTKNRLLTDAGVSSLKAAEIGEKTSVSPEEIKKLLEDSRGYLKEISSPNNRTKTNLSIIEKKLNKFEVVQ